jgi:hypothetical protein
MQSGSSPSSSLALQEFVQGGEDGHAHGKRGNNSSRPLPRRDVSACMVVDLDSDEERDPEQAVAHAVQERRLSPSLRPAGSNLPRDGNFARVGSLEGMYGGTFDSIEANVAVNVDLFLDFVGTADAVSDAVSESDDEGAGEGQGEESFYTVRNPVHLPGSTGL